MIVKKASSMIEQYFETHRRHLIGLAYRMLGSVHDAEEVVQETFLRFQSADGEELENPRAWLTRVCTRICLDRMKRLSSKLEKYPGQWLPEPYIEPEDQASLDETLSMALLVGLHALSPKERAVFLLHDIFDFRFAEIADTLDLTPTNCRQLAVRARRRVRQARKSSKLNSIELTDITQAFLRAIHEGDTETLQDILAEEVKLRSDGGGKVAAVPYPLLGRHKVQTFLLRVFSSIAKGEPVRSSTRWFNGAPGLLLEVDDQPATAIQLHIEEGKIMAIFVQRNPDKMRRLLGRKPL